MRRVLAAILVVFAAAALAEEPLPNAADPQAVEQVKSGARPDANAAWWGYNPDDATDALQAAVDSGAKSVLVPYTGRPWIIRPVRLRGNLALVFEPGVVVLAKEGEFRGKGHSLFSATDAANVSVTGYGATLRMRKKDYQNPPYEKAEWRMGLDFTGCENVLVEGLRIESTGGDGIYIGATATHPYCKNVAIRNVVCHDNHRQGISVISVEDLVIENCVLSNTGGTAPQAGIDFEPNGANERLVRCAMRRCLVENNAGDGILLYLRPLSRESEPVSITVENCLIRGDAHAGMAVAALDDDAPGGTIEFRNCVVENPAREGANIADKSPGAARVRFSDCHFYGAWANNTGSRHSPVAISVGDRGTTSAAGGIDFVNCHVYDTAQRPAIAYSAPEGIPLHDVTGVLVVHNPQGATAALGPPNDTVRLNIVPSGP